MARGRRPKPKEEPKTEFILVSKYSDGITITTYYEDPARTRPYKVIIDDPRADLR